MFQDPTFWVAVAFVIIVVGLFRPASRALGKGLDDRAEKIRQTLNEAEALRVEAQNLLADYKRKQRDALGETERMLEHAKEEALRIQVRATADLEQALARRGQQAEEKIQQAEAAAIKAVRDRAADIAVAATARLLQEKLDDKRAAGLMDESIGQVASKLN